MVLYFTSFFKKGETSKIFCFYLAIMLLIQVISEVFYFFKENNLYLSHFYFLLQFMLLSGFYLRLLSKNFQKKWVKFGFVFCLVALLAQYMLHPNLWLAFNLFEVFITSFLLIIYATFHLYNLLDGQGSFYQVSLGILIYLFGSTVLFLVGNLMTNLNPEINTITWGLNAFLYIVFQLFILVGWKKRLVK